VLVTVYHNFSISCIQISTCDLLVGMNRTVGLPVEAMYLLNSFHRIGKDSLALPFVSITQFISGQVKSGVYVIDLIAFCTGANFLYLNSQDCDIGLNPSTRVNLSSSYLNFILAFLSSL
jgi:hypothetical protein